MSLAVLAVGALVFVVSARGSMLDPRDPFDLARDVEAARMDSTDETDPFVGLAESWSNRTYRWSLRYLEPLCTAADNCRLLPFDHRRGPALGHGWLVTANMSEDERRRLQTLCRSVPRCVVQVEGKLVLTAEAGLPPHVLLQQVAVRGVRPAGNDEAWVRRR